MHSFTEDFGAGRLLCWRLYLQLLCWRWGSAWEEGVWSGQNLLQCFSSCTGRRCFRNCCSLHLAIALLPLQEKSAWLGASSEVTKSPWVSRRDQVPHLCLSKDEWVKWVSPLVLLYIVLHQGDYSISWGSINDEESMMNCCSCYEECGGRRMSAGGGNAELAMGQPQPTPESLFHQWGTAAAWAGGSHKSLSHCFKSTNLVSPMSSASY